MSVGPAGNPLLDEPGSLAGSWSLVVQEGAAGSGWAGPEATSGQLGKSLGVMKPPVLGAWRSVALPGMGVPALGAPVPAASHVLPGHPLQGRVAEGPNPQEQVSW